MSKRRKKTKPGASNAEVETTANETVDASQGTQEPELPSEATAPVAEDEGLPLDVASGRALEPELDAAAEPPGEGVVVEHVRMKSERIEVVFESAFDLGTAEDPEDVDGFGDAPAAETPAEIDRELLQRNHLCGLLEALVFASDSPIKPHDLAKLASAPLKEVKEQLVVLQERYATRGIHLDEVAGGWVFRTSPQYAPFVRDLTKQKPVRLTRSQVETLAIIAYRQPVTRPEVDEVRGVDSGPVVKVLLERDLIRILGKRDEPGRPLIYGTTNHFLEFFGLKSLKDLPTLREFTELSDESREAFEDELGESPDTAAAAAQAPGDGAEDLHELDGRIPQESMRVPIGERDPDELRSDARNDFEEEELAPISGVEGVLPPDAEDAPDDDPAGAPRDE